MTDDKPVWLLDVDGVINVDIDAWGDGLTVGSADAGHEGVFRMRWAPKLVRRIGELAQSGAVDVRWATTWCPYADQLEKLWGLPELSRAWSNGLYGYEVKDAKRSAAENVLWTGRPLIWTDDTEAHKIPSGDRALCIKPNATYGLTPAHLSEIEEFIDKMNRKGDS